MTAEKRVYGKQDQQILMVVFNKARIAAVQGKSYKGKVLEIGRVKRAFGILQSIDYLGIEGKRYFTGIENCTCPDCQYRKEFICKHRTAMMIWERIGEIEDNADFLTRNWEMMKVEVVKERRSEAQIMAGLGY